MQLHRVAFTIAVVLGSARVLAAAAPAEILISDFPGNTFANWAVTGDAFKHGPAHGKQLLSKLEIENAADDSVISSEIDDDGPQGTLTSPPIKVERDYIAFRVAGGNYEFSTCVNLLVDGAIVRSATGWNSDRLVPISWDVRALHGRNIQIEIVDKASGDWGHINVDRIVQIDHPEKPPATTQPLYHESLRPQFHFTARQWTTDRLNPRERQEGWINDLNGLIYYDGEYHLFAQRWAKCWLHAVSKDLIHWTELPPALWEESEGSGVQSGTCVVDYNNTTGLSPDSKNPPLIAFWPRFDNKSICISYSLDHARSWKYYDHNPILTHPERDPKVFWYAPGKHWVMFLYGEEKYHILTSPDALHWTDVHHPIADSFECPDFFELPVDGDASNKKWVLIQGNGKYTVGTFDGSEFKEETPRLVSDPGDFYATQSWSNVETGDGRRIQTAWMRFSLFPDMPFCQQITFPCELSLHKTPEGLRIFRRPIQQIGSLHIGDDVWSGRTLHAGQELELEPNGRLFHIKASLDLPPNGKAELNIRGVTVVLTPNSIQIGDRTTTLSSGTLHMLEVLVDRTSIEAFGNEGQLSLTKFVLPKENGITLKAIGGEVGVQSLHVYRLKSAWDDAITD